MTGRSRTAAAVTAAVAVLAGCGGGVSKEDYAQDLDEICSELEEQLESIGRIEPDNPSELSSQLDKVRNAIDGGIQDLKGIERPDGEVGETGQEYVESLESTFQEQFLPALEQLEEAVKTKDRVKIRAAATRLQSLDEERTEELARDLGADECAEG